MELYERGFITLEDTGGIALEFGNAEAMVEVVRLTGVGEGFGKKLALGSYRLAESYGHPELSMTVKKQEMPAYDPRAIQGIGLNYATATAAAATCAATRYRRRCSATRFEGGQGHDRRQAGSSCITVQNLTAALDSTGACLFTTFGIGCAELAEMLSALTGVEYTAEEFMKCGERIWNLERLWNLKAGLTAKDDTLPPRLLKEPIKTGPSKGMRQPPARDAAEYYSCAAGTRTACRPRRSSRSWASAHSIVRDAGGAIATMKIPILRSSGTSPTRRRKTGANRRRPSATCCGTWWRGTGTSSSAGC